MNIFSLKNKKAIVTGASRGIGKAIAIGLAQAGADVVCSSTSKEGSKDTVEAINKIGRKAFQVVANLSNRSDQEKLISTSIDLLGGLDILVTELLTRPNKFRVIGSRPRELKLLHIFVYAVTIPLLP